MSSKIVRHNSTNLFNYVNIILTICSKTTDVTIKLHLDYILTDTVELEVAV